MTPDELKRALELAEKFTWDATQPWDTATNEYKLSHALLHIARENERLQTTPYSTILKQEAKWFQERNKALESEMHQAKAEWHEEKKRALEIDKELAALRAERDKWRNAFLEEEHNLKSVESEVEKLEADCAKLRTALEKAAQLAEEMKEAGFGIGAPDSWVLALSQPHPGAQLLERVEKAKALLAKHSCCPACEPCPGCNYKDVLTALDEKDLKEGSDKHGK